MHIIVGIKQRSDAETQDASLHLEMHLSLLCFALLCFALLCLHRSTQIKHLHYLCIESINRLHLSLHCNEINEMQCSRCRNHQISATEVRPSDALDAPKIRETSSATHCAEEGGIVQRWDACLGQDLSSNMKKCLGIAIAIQKDT